MIQLIGIFEKERPGVPMRVDHGRMMLDDAGKGYNPVSYTHLDVYKRQDYAWLGIVVQFIDENKKDVKHVIESLDDIYNYEDEFFKAIDMYAVSYTHLSELKFLSCISG